MPFMVECRRSLLLLAAVWAAVPRRRGRRLDPLGEFVERPQGGNFPLLAISCQGDIFYSFLPPAQGTTGQVWRGSLNDPNRAFTLMPGFPLAPPPAARTTPTWRRWSSTRTANPSSACSPTAVRATPARCSMTWDESAGQWFAPPINPPTAVCAHRIANMAVSANGDIWAGCQWHGLYHSTDQGRTFDYVDVDALMLAQHPEYFPTREDNVNTLGAIYGVTTAPDDTVYLGTETGGVVYSPDHGATWNPLDQQDTNPMSPMMRMTVSGDVAGLGVMADGRLLVQGGANDPYDFWIMDRAKATVTPIVSFPQYYLGNQTV